MKQDVEFLMYVKSIGKIIHGLEKDLDYQKIEFDKLKRKQENQQKIVILLIIINVLLMIFIGVKI